ncbi:MAG: sulfurtransferase-like selenium metabolism protein YedF [Streptococcaceae bacterium]|jgi:selenium metabolism protein YedF|nr:sulfurtransferase-like selenium metabolism protein YedF [Streptococcaceae bacterium]
MFKINAIGKACPLPVIETKRALAQNDVVETLVDNEVATQNLQKMATQLGLQTQITHEGENLYRVILAKTDTEIINTPTKEQTLETSYAVVIDRDMMGQGDEALGRNLLKMFVYSLTEQDVLPDTIIFYHGGVHLVTKDSDSVEDLIKLAEHGVNIYSCGACLDFYDLTDKLAVGEITNMYTIVEMMRSANRILKP